MSATFGLDLRAFSQKTGIRMDQVLRKVVLDMTGEIVQLTPFDTGLAKNNYFWGRERLDSVETNPDTSGAASVGRASSFAATVQGGGVFYITNNLPYILMLEFGGYHGPTEKVTAEGFSKQAPAGMARITVARWQELVNAAVAS